MGKTARLMFVLVLPLALCVFHIPQATAESGTIIVTSVNQLANAVYGAVDGSTIFVKNGTYEYQESQTLVISRSVSLVGEDPDSTILNLYPRRVEPPYPYSTPYYENAIEVRASDVLLSGFTINSVGGSLSASGSRVQITGNIINTYVVAEGRYQNISMNILTEGIQNYGTYNNIERNTIIGHGIWAAGDFSIINGNNITYCNTESEGYGIMLQWSGNTVFNNLIENCNHGVSVLGTSSLNNIYANMVVNNVGGLELFGEGSNNAFHDNYVADNTYGVLLSHTVLRTAGENNTVYHNNFVDNAEQINSRSTYYGNYGSEAAIYTIGDYDNGKEGNYWSDYTGKDADGNGIGDTRYSKDLYPLMYSWGAPDVYIIGLENATYFGSFSLNFMVNKPTSWMGYSLDGFYNVTIDGNLTLTGLSSGLHSITVYAKDMFENAGTSETVFFTAAEKPEPQQDPFPKTLLFGSIIAAVAVVGLGLLVYFKKRKH